MSAHTPGPLDPAEYGCGCKAHISHMEWCPLHAAARALLEALERLIAECSALQIAAIREGLGNTNAAVFGLRVQEARAAIAAAKGAA